MIEDISISVTPIIKYFMRQLFQALHSHFPTNNTIVMIIEPYQNAVLVNFKNNTTLKYLLECDIIVNFVLHDFLKK